MEDAWVVGRVFYDRIPGGRFPAWASRILRVVYSRSPAASPPLEQLLILLVETQDWPRAKEIFHAQRKSTLELEAVPNPTREQRLQLCIGLLVEAVAKATYNRLERPDPFDDDSGHWIAGCLREVARLVDDGGFRSLAWSALLG